MYYGEHYSVVVRTPPAAEPVTVAEAKVFCRIDHTDEDSLLGDLITAARRAAEAWTGRAFVRQSLRLAADGWPAGTTTTLFIPRPPLLTVATVRYHDEAGVLQTLSPSAYIVDAASDPGRIVLVPDGQWPATQSRRAGAVEVDYDAGYGDPADVPEEIKVAIQIAVEQWHADRGRAGELPDAAKALLGSIWTGVLV
jgi:uncharacterized phiE125 gp8 family phage protein